MDSDKKTKRPLLGELLVNKGIISQKQLELALKEQEKTGNFLAQIILERRWAAEEPIYITLSEQIGIQYQKLIDIEIPQDAIRAVPDNMARAYNLIPIKREEDYLTIAMTDPQNAFAIDKLRVATGLKIKTVLSAPREIQAAIERHYGEEKAIDKTLTVQQTVGEDKKDKEKEYDTEDTDKIRRIAEEAPIVKLVDAILRDGIRNRASDIHIEPTKESFRIRFRIDGILHDITTPPHHLYKPVVSRIKIMANLDIAEKRLPQDGSFVIELEKKIVDVRVSSYPTIYGEKIVTRLLVKDESFYELSDLGFEEKELGSFNFIIRKSCGIILVVGPTGCGKTTTLYSVLSNIISSEKNIITVEDPIEYKIDGISQSQVNPKAGFTFANSLRSIMRQDPDVIMVGEIRDLDTASLAVRAALTGHLVFSTLHTNDSVGAVTRLIDMQIEPFLIASSLIGVLAQRLVRVICSDCKHEFKPTPAVLDIFDKELKRMNLEEAKFYKGKGCSICKYTGYKGREGVFELFTIEGDRIKEAITSRTSSFALKKIAVENGMTTLKENGLIKVIKGRTTLEEILRATELV